MPIADIAIVLLIALSVIVGIARGFVKEAISIAALLIAIWASLNVGAQFGELAGGWLSSTELQVWFGRIVVFVVIIVVGGLVSWGIAKMVRLSVLSGTDRALGALFGFSRAALLLGVFALGGQAMDLDRSDWWRDSLFMPYSEVVADWLRVMAPKGLEMMQSGPDIELPVSLKERFSR